MKRPPIRVSDHALLRHLERAHGLPVEALRQGLERRLHVAVQAMGDQMPTPSSAHVDGMTYIQRGDTWVTVLDGHFSNRHDRHPDEEGRDA